MGKPLTTDERQAILDTFHDTDNVRETAKRHGRSPSTVSEIISKAGLIPSGRSQTKTACDARRVDTAARIEVLKSDILDDVRRLRVALWEPCVEKKALVVSDGVHAGAHVEIVEIHYDRPPFSDQQRIMTSVGIGVDKLRVLEQVGTGTGEGQGKSLIERLVEGLAAA